jgi:tetratricopeptide (TPR) repeat protein
MGLALVQPARAEGNAGPYLAARIAFAENDFAAAARYYTQALVQDPKNTEIMRNAILAFTGEGDMERALAVSHRLQSLDSAGQVANLLLLAEAVKAKNYDDAAALLAQGETVGPLVDGLALAWVQVGQGNMSAALEGFDKVAAQSGLQSFGLFHKALALTLAGDLEGANAVLSGENGPNIPATRRGVLAQAEILSQLERNDDALVLIDAVFGGDLDPTFAAVEARLKAGETLPITSVRNAQDGLAELFFSVAGALSGEANDSYTLVYSRVAEYLRPDHTDAILLTAQLLENLQLYQLATQAYDRIGRDDPAFMTAELGRADALRRSGKDDAAIEVLQQLAKSHADQPSVHIALGDALRRLKRYTEATAAYDRAVALYDKPDASQWVLYYTRGITHERSDHWALAEADFRKALELKPDQPNVLNYLGYSFVEMQTNLDEALGMIERAVAARPNDGYITDSLGWVLYRMGRYREAVAHMERATELMPVDPIVNDHLGDVYWAVGRKREARFQWNRAMSFDPEEKDAARIRRKLAVGLDEVLKEEGADPISLADDN